MKYFCLLIVFIFIAVIGHAQQVNGYFTPFASNNQWGNTVINSAQLENSGYITLGGYYEGALRTSFSNGVYNILPNKIPMMLQINSLGVIRGGFGSSVSSVFLMSSVNSNNGSTVIDKTFIANSSSIANNNMLIVAGHEDDGDGFLVKTFPTGARPTAFNGGQITTLSGSAASSKGYIEDWHTGSIMYSIRINGATFGNARILLSAFGKDNGAALNSFGDSGTTKIAPPDGIIYTARPAKMAVLSTVDPKIYVAFSTIAGIGNASNVVLCRVNYYDGKIDSSFGSNGYKQFPTAPGYYVTSVLVNNNESVTIGGYGDEGQQSVPSFITFKNDGSFSITSFNHLLGQPLPGYGSKNIAAKLATINGEQRIVFAYAKPINTNDQFRIAIASHQPGSVAADPLVHTPWISSEFISAEPTEIITLLNNTGFIVTGKATRSNGTFAGVVIKYNIDGTLSTSFGNQGILIINGRQGGNPWTDATQLPDNKYLAIASAGFIPTAPEKKALLLNRFYSNGSIDTSFGTSGTLYVYPSDYSRQGTQVHALAGGKFLIGGTYTNYQNEPGIGTGNNGPKATIYKFNADGSPDNNFGTFQNGKLVFSGYTGLDFKEMRVQDDTIYMAGTTALSHTGNANAFIYKLSPDGIPVGSYLPYLRAMHTFTISDVTGIGYVGGGLNGSAKQICKVKRPLTGSSGRPDSSFGTNGIAIIPVTVAGEINTIKQIKLRPGYILVVTDWATSNSASATTGLYFTLISQDGIVETVFGTNGNKFLQLPGATSIKGEHFKWTENGNRLLIFGQATVNGNADEGFICKVDLDGNLVADFGTNGVIWTNETFEDNIFFDNAQNMIAIKNYQFFNGGALAKLEIPADVYNRIKQGSWTGAANNDWFNTGNWAGGNVPDAFTEVIIATGQCIIPPNSVAFAYKVQVNPGASLTIGQNSSLIITYKNP